MGRIPCCEKDNVKRGQWTPEEDTKLSSYIALHGTRNWRLITKNAGLQRCGKSCRLRWTNYLRPDLKHGEFSESEEETIVKLHSVVGNRWSLITAQLPGRTDNDVKNYWNTKLKKKLSSMGIDPVTHKPFSHLMAEIATALPPTQVAHLAEAALGCFKDEMLHLLTKKRTTDFAGPSPISSYPGMAYASMNPKLGLSRAIMQEPYPDNTWTAAEPSGDGFVSMWAVVGDNEPTWSPSMCTGSTCTGGAGGQEGGSVMHEKGGEEAEGGNNSRDDEANMFSSDLVLWDLPDDLMNPIV